MKIARERDAAAKAKENIREMAEDAIRIDDEEDSGFDSEATYDLGKVKMEPLGEEEDKHSEEKDMSFPDGKKPGARFAKFFA
jgi:hypothetical protein